MKVLLILIDGMRPDSLTNVEYAQEFIKKSTYTLGAKTVLPSDTLPCHMSLYHSVSPDVHKTKSNTFNANANPIKGLCEVLSDTKKSCAFFYSWGELRDLVKPGSLTHSCFINGDKVTFAVANDRLTDCAIDYLKDNDSDFTFLYLGNTDAIGHKHGWMGKEYLKAVENSFKNVKKIYETLSDEYTVIITADHGGHDYTHGTSSNEDMTIPVIINGANIECGKQLYNVSIKDIAPTIVSLLGVEPNSDWEGKNLL